MVRKIDKIKEKTIIRKIYSIIKEKISNKKLITCCNDGIFIIFNDQDDAMYAEIDVVLKNYENEPRASSISIPEQKSYKPYVDSDEDLSKLSIKERILLRRNDIPEKCITFGN